MESNFLLKHNKKKPTNILLHIYNKINKCPRRLIVFQLLQKLHYSSTINLRKYKININSIVIFSISPQILIIYSLLWIYVFQMTKDLERAPSAWQRQDRDQISL